MVVTVKPQARPAILYSSATNLTDLDLPDVFRSALNEVGVLTVSVNDELRGADLEQRIRESDVWLICRNSQPIPEVLASRPGRLKAIVATVGSLRQYVPRSFFESGVTVCNWGDAPADAIAAGTLTLLLAVLSDLHHHIDFRRNGGWKIDPAGHGGSLFGETVGLYGFGLIARRFRELIRPFDCEVLAYDPYAHDVPDDVELTVDLDELFRRSRIVSIHAGLTETTRHSVGARQLSLMADDSVLVNTGRGDIVDQEALFRELASGRLRGGLDVLAGDDTLPADHPARGWENLILTGHQIHLGWPRHGRAPTSLSKAQAYALDNITRLAAGRALTRVVDAALFDRMT